MVLPDVIIVPRDEIDHFTKQHRCVGIYDADDEEHEPCPKRGDKTSASRFEAALELIATVDGLYLAKY